MIDYTPVPDTERAPPPEVRAWLIERSCDGGETWGPYELVHWSTDDPLQAKVRAHRRADWHNRDHASELEPWLFRAASYVRGE